METPEPETAIREAIRHWSRLSDLAEFAAHQHGFGDSNGGFGVTYPGDLDEYDRKVSGASIPAGWGEVYGFWGPPNGYEVLVPEQVYLTVLAETLAAAGHSEEAALVRSQAEQQKPTEQS